MQGTHDPRFSAIKNPPKNGDFARQEHKTFHGNSLRRLGFLF